MTEWERILSRKPSPAVFKIIMNADSSNEEWVDIPTKLDKDHAWHVVGMRYVIESIDPTVPLLSPAAQDNVLALQVHRTDDHETLLPSFDEQVLASNSRRVMFTASGMHEIPLMFESEHDEVTRSPVLRAIFRTATDMGPISGTTVHLNGVLLYHLITAPDDGRTKLGIPIDEI